MANIGASEQSGVNIGASQTDPGGTTKIVSALTMTSILASAGFLVSKVVDSLSMLGNLIPPIPQAIFNGSPLSISASVESITPKVTKSIDAFDLVFTLNNVTLDLGGGTPVTVSVQALALALGLPTVGKQILLTPESLALAMGLQTADKSILMEAQGALGLTLELPAIDKRVLFEPVSQTISLTLNDVEKLLTVQVTAQELTALLNSVTTTGALIKRRIGPRVYQFIDPVKVTLRLNLPKILKAPAEAGIVKSVSSPKAVRKPVENKITSTKFEG